MRVEKEFDVNVQLRAQRAAERVGANGHLQGVVDVPQVKWYHRYFKWENLTVAGRAIEKGLVLTPTMGLTIILAFAGMMGAMYWRMNDAISAQGKTIGAQNELLIRLDQRLIDKESHDAEFKREQKDGQDIQDLKIQDLKDKLLVLNAKVR